MIDCMIVSYMAAIITLNFIAKSCVFYDSVMQMSKTQKDERAEKGLECAMPKAMRHEVVTLSP